MPDWPVRHPGRSSRRGPRAARTRAAACRGERIPAAARPLNVAYAEGLVRVGRASEARMRLDATLARCRAHGEHLFVPELLRVTGVAMLEQARSAAPMSRSRTRPTGIVICRWRSRPRTGRAPRCGLRGALDLADHLIERGRTAHASTLVAGVARHFDPHSRAHDVRRLLRVQNFVRGRAAAVPHACAPRRRRRGAAGHSDARVPGSRATARSRHACRCVRRSRVPSFDDALARRGAACAYARRPTVLRATEPARAADLVVFNGKIATQDEQRSFVSALAVKDGASSRPAAIATCCVMHTVTRPAST